MNGMRSIYWVILVLPFIWAYLAIRSGQKSKTRKQDLDINTKPSPTGV